MINFLKFYHFVLCLSLASFVIAATLSQRLISQRLDDDHISSGTDLEVAGSELNRLKVSFENPYSICYPGRIISIDDASMAIDGLAGFCSPEGNDSLTFRERVTYYHQSAYAFISVALTDSTVDQTGSCSQSFVVECMAVLDKECGEDGKGYVGYLSPIIECGRGNRGDTI